MLRLASADTVGRIAHLAETEDIGTVAVMCVSLYFTRLKLFGVNGKKCDWRQRLVFCWCSMIWLSSYTSKSRLGTNQKNSRANVQNTVTETIGMVFSIPHKDIYAPRFLTTEPAEHQIAGWRMRKREATVLEVNQMEHMVTNRTRAIFESDLQISRRRQNGYHSTLDSHVDATKLLPLASYSGLVDLAFGEADKPVVDQLWLCVGPVINSMFVRMTALLN